MKRLGVLMAAVVLAAARFAIAEAASAPADVSGTASSIAVSGPAEPQNLVGLSNSAGSSSDVTPTGASGTAGPMSAAKPGFIALNSPTLAFFSWERWEAPLAFVGGSAVFVAGALAFDHNSNVAYNRYRAATGNFDRQWATVQHWEVARDASIFIASGFGFAAFVAATRGPKPSNGAIFGLVPTLDAIFAWCSIPLELPIRDRRGVTGRRVSS